HVTGELKSMLGSGAITVFDDTSDPLKVSWRIARFYAHESCGKCTPCREGSGWIERVLYRMANRLGLPSDLDLLLHFRSHILSRPDRPFPADHHRRARPEHDEPRREPRAPLRRRDPRALEARPRQAPRVAGRIMTANAVPMSQWPSEHDYTIPVAPGPDLVTVTIDGNVVQAPRGELLIKVAQQHGTVIPRFCYHERMRPVGMCRLG